MVVFEVALSLTACAALLEEGRFAVAAGIVVVVMDRSFYLYGGCCAFCRRIAQRSLGKVGFGANNAENIFIFGDFLVFARCAFRRKKRNEFFYFDSRGMVRAAELTI